ncbi:MAG: M48 family metallopeptidase [Clostridia bacterium]|nr:M48 family metallopeptidase [Clostridia bacterium]
MKATIIRSKRKTVSLQVKQDGDLIIRAPLWYRESDAEKLLLKHQAWIEKTRKRMDGRTVFPEDKECIERLKDEARRMLPQRVDHYARIMNLHPALVRIGSARGRFGSCSSKGNLNFSCFLMLYPQEAIDYVVVHELAHLKHKGHDRSFYALIERYMPDYKDRERLLKK